VARTEDKIEDEDVDDESRMYVGPSKCMECFMFNCSSMFFCCFANVLDETLMS
jgi:hypothetical protein